MAPRPTSDQGPPKGGWDNWVPPICPYIEDIDMWGKFNPPWKVDVSKHAVNKDRTARLAEYNDSVRIGVDRETVNGVHGGQPFMRLENQPCTNTKTYEAKIPPSWSRGLFPNQTIPLPDWNKGGEYVRRFGDPTVTGTDAQAYMINGVTKKYYEMSSFGPSIFPYTWRADRIHVWDLNVDWTKQNMGISAAKIPVLPMIPRIEEYETGRIEHAIHFVSASYSDEPWIAPARNSDPLKYLIKGHPLRAGERLRLRSDVAALLLLGPTTLHDRAFIYGVMKYGMILTDRTSPDVPHSVRQPMDPRLDMSIKLQLTDFEVLA
jgi:hypothetical protein